jgi:hypothetical protein
VASLSDTLLIDLVTSKGRQLVEQLATVSNLTNNVFHVILGLIIGLIGMVIEFCIEGSPRALMTDLQERPNENLV